MKMSEEEIAEKTKTSNQPKREEGEEEEDKKDENGKETTENNAIQGHNPQMEDLGNPVSPHGQITWIHYIRRQNYSEMFFEKFRLKVKSESVLNYLMLFL